MHITPCAESREKRTTHSSKISQKYLVRPNWKRIGAFHALYIDPSLRNTWATNSRSRSYFECLCVEPMSKTELMGRFRRRHQCQVRCATEDFDLTSNMEATIPRMSRIALRKLGHPLGYGAARQKRRIRFCGSRV